MKNVFIVMIVIACLCLGCCAGRFVLDSLNVDWAQNYNELPQNETQENNENEVNNND